MSKEAMKQALEALERIGMKDWVERKENAIATLRTAIEQAEKQEPAACDGDFPEGFDESFGIPAQALRQANAALCEVTNNRMWDVPALAERMMLFRTHTIPPAYDQGWKDGYKHGAWANTAAPVQEPVAITEQMAFAFHNAITDGAIGTDDLMDIMRGLEAAFAHITTPPAAQRTWVGLTDEDIIKCTPNWIGTLEDVARAIEAKLKEKNT